jgi:DNA-binding LytR/AlgR family response regulator
MVSASPGEWRIPFCRKCRLACHHRGTLVNLPRIREVHPLFKGGAEVVLQDGTRLDLSRRLRAGARTVLGLR